MKTLKIENFITNQSGLQEEFDKDSTVSNVRITPSTAHTCTTIVEELADRDRRKRNIVMYNLPDREADKVSAISLIKSVYKLESPISRVVHLGKRIKDKHSPLLVCFENMDDKAIVLSHSYLLHQKEQFKMVFACSS